ERGRGFGAPAGGGAPGGAGPEGAAAAPAASAAQGAPGSSPGTGRPGGPGGRGSQRDPEPPPPAESVDQVLDKYMQALGGQAALARAKTRVMRGTATGRDLQTMPINVQEKVTGEYRIDTQGRQGAQTRVYDGKSA